MSAELADDGDGLRRAGERLDVLLRGRVRLLQDPRGYRTSVDAMLLGWFAARHAPNARTVIDLGAGSGLVSIVIGMGLPAVRLHLVELQSTLADRARRNLALNGLQARATVHLHDAAQAAPAGMPAADLLVCNPPYFRQHGRLLPTHPERLGAHYETSADIATLAAFAADRLLPGGRAAWIYPAADRERLLSGLQDAGLRQLTVHELEHRPAARPITRVLVLATRGSPGITAGEAIALHPADRDDSCYHADIEAFLAGLHS